MYNSAHVQAFALAMRSTVHVTAAGSCTVTAAQAGNADYSAAASVPRSFTFNSGGDIALAPTLRAITITAGQSGINHIRLTPNPATVAALNFTCSGLTAEASCTFAPNPVPAGSAPTDAVMTIATTQEPSLTCGNHVCFTHNAWVSPERD